MDIVKIDQSASGDRLEIPKLHLSYAFKDPGSSHAGQQNDPQGRKELKVLSE
jgi:hypothetical protein